MTVRVSRVRHLTRRLAPVVAAATLSAVTVSGAVTSSSAAAPASTAGCAGSGSAARVAKGGAAAEPALYAAKDAGKYGVIKPHPMLPAGSVTVETVFHVVTGRPTTPAERSRYATLIAAQVKVLNDAYAGRTSPDAAASPFRFALERTTYTVNAAWASLAPGKAERDVKRALHEGDSETLNVYVGDLGGGLLGYAYFPKGYNNGRDYVDGVVMLDESMPGGTAAPYNRGDTLTHEVGHWMGLEHTFASACSASGDGVADTPREAVPQFGCPVGADTCAAPGLDPVHNFMDYSDDGCMDTFTPGQAQRMNDAWIEFRVGGNG
ncbi:zinc metalloprotease [Kineococcus rhizosphaerae]|uniref:Pregnancy-associated plasma protein-A n=1 Tax=Kineococcus rhizosphaerae TaxID=559628 RepID=A0A2T0R2J5_9ACTN|nr:zinc metalloprotease [Kineococcus rhizosphaerae]PRY13995.1 pregnancy-associated plasma protein-A [Kineococcus rhizosphaerae]